MYIYTCTLHAICACVCARAHTPLCVQYIQQLHVLTCIYVKLYIWMHMHMYINVYNHPYAYIYTRAVYLSLYAPLIRNTVIP